MLKEVFTREGIGTTLVTAIGALVLVGYDMFVAATMLAQGYSTHGWIMFAIGVIVAIIAVFAIAVNRDTAYYIGKRHVYQERTRGTYGL